MAEDAETVAFLAKAECEKTESMNKSEIKELDSSILKVDPGEELTKTEKESPVFEELTYEEIGKRVRKVLVDDGHWERDELEKITLKSVKPFLKEAGVNTKLYKAQITKNILEFLQSLTDDNTHVESEEESEAEEEEEDDDDDDDLHDKTTPQWNSLPNAIKERVMEVVWAKTPGFPIWPSLIYHPANVSGNLKKNILKCCSTKYLVLNYDGADVPSWQFVLHENCLPFDPATVSEHACVDKKGKPATARLRASWEKGLEHALQEHKLDRWERAQWIYDAVAERKQKRLENRVDKPRAKKEIKAKKTRKSKKKAVQEDEQDNEVGHEQALDNASDQEQHPRDKTNVETEIAVEEEEQVEELEEDEKEEFEDGNEDEEEEFDDYTPSSKKHKTDKSEKKVKKEKKPAESKKRSRSSAPESTKKKKSIAIDDPKVLLPRLHHDLGNDETLPHALKALWKLPMDGAMVKLAAEIGLIKSVKSLKKQHMSDKVKQQASMIFSKWQEVVAAASSDLPLLPTPPSTLPSKREDAPTSVAKVAVPSAKVESDVIDEKFRAKVKGALGKMNLKDTISGSVELALISAAKESKSRLKELTRKLAKELETTFVLDSLNAGELPSTELIQRLE